MKPTAGSRKALITLVNLQPTVVKKKEREDIN